MTVKFYVSRYYITSENHQRLLAFTNSCGDKRPTLIMQFIRGWLSLNREYYTRLAKADKEGRLLTSENWVGILLDEDFKVIDDVYPIVNPQEITEPDPMRNVFLPKVPQMTLACSVINLSRQNYLLLKTAIYYHGVSSSVFVSKIIHEHMQRNWARLYQPQIAADMYDTWL